MWIYVLVICSMSGCEDYKKEIPSPIEFQSLGECHDMSYLAEKVLNASGYEVVDNWCEIKKD